MDMKEVKYNYLGREETYGESQKCINLIKKFNQFTKKVYGIEFSIFGYDEILGYSNDFGYYKLYNYGGETPLELKYGFNEDEVFFRLLDYFLINAGMYYEYDNREKFQKDFKNRFSDLDFKKINQRDINVYDEYFNDLYYYEYALDKWDKYYDGNIPLEIIGYYQNILNNDSWSNVQKVIWKYNLEIKKFDCKKNEKVRKLERNS